MPLTGTHRTLIWVAVSLVVSFGLQMILPFPLGLIAAIGIFFGLPFVISRVMTSGGAGNDGRRMSFFGNSNNRGDLFKTGKVKYVCLVCGLKHNGGSCSRCGSKMQRADF